MPEEMNFCLPPTFRLSLQCAPLFFRLKPGELYSAAEEEAETVAAFFRGTGISVRVLGEKGNRRVIYLFWEREIRRILKKREDRELLCEFGYPERHWREQLDWLEVRFGRYCAGTGGFPHEIGVFLGYPVADVRGFMENQGKGSLYRGYWKVYSDVEQARKRFASYHRAKQLMYVAASGTGQDGTGSMINRAVSK